MKANEQLCSKGKDISFAYKLLIMHMQDGMLLKKSCLKKAGSCRIVGFPPHLFKGVIVMLEAECRSYLSFLLLL